jgi:TDG/mug DNA glycosylase family protein
MSRIIGKVLPPLRDRIRPGVEVLFVGINPGVRSALIGHHFAGFSNRFWKLLYEARLVPRPIGCEDDDRLPEWGYGITNIVARATPVIDTLRPHEYVAGRTRLVAKVRRYRPRVVALVGVTVFRALFPDHKGRVDLGLQQPMLGDSAVFVLPNTSGRNANFSYAEMLEAFRSLGRCRARLYDAAERTNESARRRSSARSRRQSTAAVRPTRSRAR